MPMSRRNPVPADRDAEQLDDLLRDCAQMQGVAPVSAVSGLPAPREIRLDDGVAARVDGLNSYGT
jgi:hypothetical protein